MKKFLLSALILGAGISSAAAQSFEFFISTKAENHQPVDFVKVTEGAVFTVSEKEIGDATEYEYNGTTFYMQQVEMLAYPKVHNMTLDDWNAQSQNSPAIGYKVQHDENNCAELGIEPMYQTCIGNCFNANPFYFSCLNNSETSGMVSDHLGYSINCNAKGQAEKLAFNTQYDYTVTLGDEKLNFTINYVVGDAAVDGIEVENAPAEYFTLQGVRVDNPEAGQIYIVRKGNKTYKVIR